MPDIFVSWGLPDAAVVAPIVERLRDAGFEVWSYTDSMLAGVNIPDDVQRTIATSGMALVVLSAQSATRPWIGTEIAWCVNRQAQDPAFQILPVRVGQVPEEALPHLLAGQARYFDLAGPDIDHAAAVRLADNARQLLGSKAPLVVPAKILAMTRNQFDSFLPQAIPAGGPAGEVARRLEHLCRAAGMESFPGLRATLRQRYGERSEDFAPFTGEADDHGGHGRPGGERGDALDPLRVDPLVEGRRLIDVVHSIQRAVNQHRRASQLHPIWLQWCGDELFSAGAGREVRERWEVGPSLLIVDSISVAHPAICEQFQRVPPPQYPKRAALLWVPPYTSHTMQLRQFTDHFVVQEPNPPNLHSHFRNWDREMADSHMAFDIATPVSLRRWLYLAFAGVAGNPLPLPSNVSAVRAMLQPEGRLSPLQFFADPRPAS